MMHILRLFLLTALLEYVISISLEYSISEPHLSHLIMPLSCERFLVSLFYPPRYGHVKWFSYLLSSGVDSNVISLTPIKLLYGYFPQTWYTLPSIIALTPIAKSQSTTFITSASVFSLNHSAISYLTIIYFITHSPFRIKGNFLNTKNWKWITFYGTVLVIP